MPGKQADCERRERRIFEQCQTWVATSSEKMIWANFLSHPVANLICKHLRNKSRIAMLEDTVSGSWHQTQHSFEGAKKGVKSHSPRSIHFPVPGA